MPWLHYRDKARRGSGGVFHAFWTPAVLCPSCYTSGGRIGNWEGRETCHCDGSISCDWLELRTVNLLLALTSPRKYSVVSRGILSIFVRETDIHSPNPMIQFLIQDAAKKGGLCFWPVKFWRARPVSAMHSDGDTWVTVQSLYCRMLLVEQLVAAHIYVPCYVEYGQVSKIMNFDVQVLTFHDHSF